MDMKKTIFGVVAAASLAGAAFAAAPAWTPPGTAYGKLPAGIYTLDDKHASLIWKVSHLGFSSYVARFEKFDAKIDFDPTKPANSKVTATVQMDSAETDYDTMDDKLDKVFFAADKFPTATFTSTKLTMTGAATGKMDGTLTLKGVSKPVTFDVTLVGAGVNSFSNAPTMGFRAVATIKRSQFGISDYLPMVGDDVTIEINAEFGKKA